jgi:predicted DNA-binding protein
MSVNQKSAKGAKVQVSFRLPRDLARRLKDAANARHWPPPPSQTEIAERGIELVLDKLQKQ